MKKKIIGILFCTLLITTILPVAGAMNVDILETENESNQPLPDSWKNKWLFIGFIKDLDESGPGWCNFTCLVVFHSTREWLNGVTDRGLYVRQGVRIPYTLRNGYVGRYFVCCMFKYDHYWPTP
jgi:hypothetical protein